MSLVPLCFVIHSPSWSINLIILYTLILERFGKTGAAHTHDLTIAKLPRRKTDPALSHNLSLKYGPGFAEPLY